MKFVFLLSMISLSLVLHASPENPADCAASGTGKKNNEIDSLETSATGLIKVVEQASCPNNSDPSKILGLCRELADRNQTTFAGKRAYVYEVMVFEAACVLPTDSLQTKQQKIQKLWRTNYNDLTCENTNFGRKKSVLKYAIRMGTFDFLSAATEDWKVNLNFTDPSDGKTVLDYIDDERKRYANSDLGTELNDYFQILRSAGAKFSKELPPTELAQK